MKSQNNKVQEDPDAALRDFANFIAKTIVETIKSADIVVLPGLLNVVSPTSGASTNPTSIFLKKPLS